MEMILKAILVVLVVQTIWLFVCFDCKPSVPPIDPPEPDPDPDPTVKANLFDFVIPTTSYKL